MLPLKRQIIFSLQKKTYLIGNPIRKELLTQPLEINEAKKILGFKTDLPLILVLGGSQGAALINKLIINNLEFLLSDFQIYHQTGVNNEEEVRRLTQDISSENYKIAGFLNVEELKIALSAADLVIARAGSNIFEIALFGKPSILIPLGIAANDHQLFNAYEYGETGAAVVIEEDRLSPQIILRQIKDILGDQKRKEEMMSAAKNFAKPLATKIIAEEILKSLKISPS